MTHNPKPTQADTPCSGGCGKVRSIRHTDDPEQWLCHECWKKRNPKQMAQDAITNGKTMGQFLRELPNSSSMNPLELEIYSTAYAEVRSTPKYIDTTWEVRSYDVWGNAKDGYEVNDSYRIGEVTLRLKVEVNNAGTALEFLSAYPSDSQIREALSLRRFKIETNGDDLHITVYRARDGYPCGELYCTSHESLSSIRAKENS